MISPSKLLLCLAFCGGVSKIFANQIVFASYTSVPSQDTSVITDITQIISPPLGQEYATVVDTSTPCHDLDAGGCPVADVAVNLPQIVIPNGQLFSSATLSLLLLLPTEQLTSSVTTIPLDSTKPFTTSSFGTTYDGTYTTFLTAAGEGFSQVPAGYPALAELDYSKPVADALLSSEGVLDPITAQTSIYFYLKGGNSIVPLGINSDTILTSYFLQHPSVNVRALIEVNTTDVPESETVALFIIGSGLIALASIRHS